MTWKNKPKDIEKYQGFVYSITHKSTGKFYIGKKFFWKTYKKKPTKYRMKDGKFVKNKKGKRVLNTRTTKQHFKLETDWKNYWGSSKNLLEDVEKYGKKAFTREILLACENKWDCAYYELIYQLDNEVLFRNDTYNEIVNVRLRRRKS